MPTYEYQCAKCGTVFDVFQSIKASPLRQATCETCGCKRSVRRLIGTGGAVIFKGSGFYQTDYRSENYKSAAKTESDRKDGKSGDAPAANAKEAAKSDAKTPAPLQKDAASSGDSHESRSKKKRK